MSEHSIPEGLGTAAPSGSDTLAATREGLDEIKLRMVNFRNLCITYATLKEQAKEVLDEINESDSKMHEDLGAIGHADGTSLVVNETLTVNPGTEEYHQTPRRPNNREPELMKWIQEHGFGGLIPLRELVRIINDRGVEIDMPPELGDNHLTITVSELALQLKPHTGLIGLSPGIRWNIERAHWQKLMEDFDSAITVDCGTCEGIGKVVWEIQTDADGEHEKWKPCDNCGGSGKVFKIPDFVDHVFGPKNKWTMKREVTKDGHTMLKTIKRPGKDW